MIHRDIKPANMLIDGRGNLWLADFGLAHCQNQAGLTMTGDLVGTLRYMSPEQALAKRVVVDHRTDIYSLGATLYELLTGEPVFGGNDRQELLRQIAFDEPKSLKRHTKAIPAELETIVLKALAKNPADRYGTAKEMAEDLERFVKDEPIHARRPSLARRARGWCRRHRPMVTAMIVLWHAAVLGGGAFLYWQDRQRTATAQAVENDWTEAETFWKQKQWPKALPALERASGRLVGSGLTALQARVDARRRDVAMINKLENARMLNVTYYHDSNARDRGPVDLAYQSAFAGYGLDVTAMDKDEIVQRIRGSEIRDYLIGGLDAWAYTKDQMPRGNGQPLSDIAQMADQDPWRIRLRQLQRRKDRAALERLAELREAASQPPDTVARLAELLESSAQRAAALQLRRKAQQLSPADYYLNYDLGIALYADKAGEAVGFFRAALAVQPESCSAHLVLANALEVSGDNREVDQLYQKAIDLQPNFGRAYDMLGEHLRRQRKWPEAEAALRKALKIKPDQHVHATLGQLWSDMGRYAQAEGEFREYLRLEPDSVNACFCLGYALCHQRKFAEAETAYRKVIELKKDSPKAYFYLGLALWNQGKTAEAEGACRKVIELKNDSPEAYLNLGTALLQQGKTAEAITAYRKAVELNADFLEPYAGLALPCAVRERSTRQNPFSAKPSRSQPALPLHTPDLPRSCLARGNSCKPPPSSPRFLCSIPTGHAAQATISSATARRFRPATARVMPPASTQRSARATASRPSAGCASSSSMRKHGSNQILPRKLQRSSATCLS